MGATGMQTDALRARIRRVRELTDKPFGVDLLLPVVTGSVETGSGFGAAGVAVRSGSATVSETRGFR